MTFGRLEAVAVLAAAAWLSLSARAGEVPAELNHQGVIAVGGERFTGEGAFRFALVNGDTDTYLWVNDGSAVFSPDAPTGAVNLSVVNGAYSVGLGDTGLANMTQVPLNLFNVNDRVVLRVWFDDLRGAVCRF